MGVNGHFVLSSALGSGLQGAIPDVPNWVGVIPGRNLRGEQRFFGGEPERARQRLPRTRPGLADYYFHFHFCNAVSCGRGWAAGRGRFKLGLLGTGGRFVVGLLSRFGWTAKATCFSRGAP